LIFIYKAHRIANHPALACNLQDAVMQAVAIATKVRIRSSLAHPETDYHPLEETQ
jgi:hypothetical protein